MSKCSEKSAAVEKGHQGKVFEAKAEGRGREMLPRCPFSTKVTFFITRGLFSEPMICPDNYDNRLLFCTLSYISYDQSDLEIMPKIWKKKIIEKLEILKNES